MRYRVDPATGVRVTTVELIVEHTKVPIPRAERGAASETGSSPVCVKIGPGETLLRKQIKPAGGEPTGAPWKPRDRAPSRSAGCLRVDSYRCRLMPASGNLQAPVPIFATVYLALGVTGRLGNSQRGKHMSIAKRIYISVPGDHVLNDGRQALKWAVIEDIARRGYIPEIFHSERPYAGSLAAGRGWTFQECANVLKRCVGYVIIGLPRYVLSSESRTFRMPTEYAHCEGSLGRMFDIPSLLLAEEGLEERGIFHWGGGQLITTFPQEGGKDWVSTDRYQTAFRLFKEKIDERRDVFLGYCSGSKGTAQLIKNFLKSQLSASVLDWRTDFLEGRTIIEEIEEAAKRTSGGVFLFTRDDFRNDEAQQGAPRDNVVFEAGYFARSKGRERVLIIREEGAKMPADLGGSIYATLTDRADIGPLEPRMRRFLETAI